MKNSCFREIRSIWKLLVTIFMPLLLLPLLVLSDAKEMRCGYVVLLMAISWTTEALPLAVTALLPIVLFPLLGILDVRRACSAFLNDASFLLLAGLMFAVAVQECDLHKRLSLFVLIKVGSEPKYIMLGFIISTGFLSMWLNNTATVAMMIPTATAIVEQILKQRRLSLERQQLLRPTIFGSKEVAEAHAPISHKPSVEQLAVTNTENPPKSALEIQLSPAFRNSTCVPVLSKAENSEDADLSSAIVAVADTSQKPAQPIHKFRTNPSLTLSQQVTIMSPQSSVQSGLRMTSTFYSTNQSKSTMSSEEQRLYSGMLLAICYAANIGGSATLTGTGPNLVLVGQLETIFPGVDTGVTYLSWMQFALPGCLINLTLSWLWLQFVFVRGLALTNNNRSKAKSVCKWQAFLSRWSPRFCRSRKPLKSSLKQFQIQDKHDNEHSIESLLQKRYNELGPLTLAQMTVGGLFLVLVVLWTMRRPGFISGWELLFEKGYVNDTCPVMIVILLLFILPKQLPCMGTHAAKKGAESTSYKPVLSWSDVQKKFPWGIMLLIGGGYSMAEGINASGLSSALGRTLEATVHDRLSAASICVVVVVVVALLTEVASNTSTANILLPIVISLARSLKVNPLYFAMPATIASCFSFMLPASNPSNAVVFYTGHVRARDMLIGGSMLSILSTAVVLVNVNTWGSWVFQLNEYPEWAKLPAELNGFNSSNHV